MLPVILFPQIDPVLVNIGPFPIRWYALSYIVGLLLALFLVRRLVPLTPRASSVEQVDDFFGWGALGVVLGGRLGYILFYQSGYYLSHPLSIFEVWHGGMSFHGGVVGVILAMFFYARKQKINFFAFSDRITVAIPIGLGLGRIANFINGELWGREASTSVPWAMIFPGGGDVPRHPSQLYEALTEGLLLFLVMYTASRSHKIREHAGMLGGLFLTGYGVARSFCEFFREPDSFLGFLPGGITMGQVLCVPMIIIGITLMARAWFAPPYAGLPDTRDNAQDTAKN
ncbi:prolipoprotein diacylglyceryl transferase [Acetobacter thailandicus]|uniref:prolipoprotein diacylglyceryl transferase n=1 Tax=Acetobacter thailandicus TaxID=1502842 RepID=UPI001BA5995A|nr:prolipoprotein diacylglyceryl transferase [Acetobacter thailandicus]MBS0979197.1 prolipoprotein diacylglyceryl transferase [Acetobacter thailandicus]